MSIWDTIAAPLIAIVNKVIPDKTAAAAAVSQLQQMALQGQLQEELAQLQAVTSAQSDIDKVEASSTSFWVAGARPAILWICGAAFGYVALIEPMLRFAATVGFGYKGGYPVIDTTLTMQVMLGMLGLGSMHMYENVQKSKGT